MKFREDLLLDLIPPLKRLARRDWRKAGFDMSYWAKHKRPKTPALGCGTSCCAYGVGTTLPSWRKAGLKLELWHQGGGGGNYFPVKDAQILLGLSIVEWSFIFSPTSKFDTPNDVIKRIEVTIANHDDQSQQSPCYF